MNRILNPLSIGIIATLFLTIISSQSSAQLRPCEISQDELPIKYSFATDDLRAADRWYEADIYGKAIHQYYKYQDSLKDYQMVRLADYQLYTFGICEDTLRAISLYKKAAALGNVEAMENLAWIYFKAYDNLKDYKQSIEWCRKIDDTSKLAMCLLGRYYQYGIEVEKDGAKAIEWYTKAARKGYTPAMVNLAIIYRDGIITEKKLDKTKYWLDRAVYQKNAWAMNELGNMYLLGEHVEQSDKKAIKYYKDAADEGFTVGEINAGHLYEKGEKTKQNYDRAYKYYLAASIAGSDIAMGYLSRAIAEGNGTKEDSAKAKSWYDDALDYGYRKSKKYISNLYYTSHYVMPEDVTRAIQLYEDAVADNNVPATYNYGRLHWEGVLVAKNDKKAITFFEKAATLGCTEAMEKLGDIYRNGEHDITKDFAQAEKWYRKAADMNNYHSMYYLATLYCTDNAGARASDGVALLQKAADKDYPEAIDYLAGLYIDGKVVTQDVDKGISLYKKAAKLDYPESMDHLAMLYQEGVNLPKDPATVTYWQNKAANARKKAEEEKEKKEKKY